MRNFLIKPLAGLPLAEAPLSLFLALCAVCSILLVQTLRKEWRRFGSSLKFCSALEELTMLDMGTLDGASALIAFSEATLPALKSISLRQCTALSFLPALHGFAALHTLDLGGCSSLTSLEVLGFGALHSLELGGCSSLARLPDLCCLPGLCFR